jgi:predicted DNA binding protein
MSDIPVSPDTTEQTEKRPYPAHIQRKRLTPAQKQDILERAERMGYRRGYQTTIAKDMGISQSCVSIVIAKNKKVA